MKAPPARRLALALSAAWLVAGLIWTFGASWSVERQLRLLTWSGWGAVGFLVLSMSASPLERVARWRGQSVKLAALRRVLGLSAAGWGLVHFAAAVLGFVGPAWMGILHRAYLRAGLMALIILLGLALTSFPRVVRALRVPLWKELHRLVYVVALFAAWHVARAPYAAWWLTFALAGVFGLGLLLRLLPRRG